MIVDLIIKIATRNEAIVDYKNPIQRSNIGTVTGLVGIVFNILITLMKIFIGLTTNSISIMADGFNNFTDAASSLVTAIGMNYAGKASDENHPHGHGRMEYLATLTISMVILFVGFTLLKSSIEGFLNPEAVEFSRISLIVLAISIGMKYRMYLFYNEIAIKIDSSTLKASAVDSIGDVMVTTIVFVAFVMSKFVTFPVDALGGIVVSVFILKSGYELIMEMVNEIVGESVDEEIIEAIQRLFDENEKIVGTHDLNFHSYGPNTVYGTIDAVVENTMTVEEVHEIFTEIEHRILDEYQIFMTIHMDVSKKETREETLLSNALETYKEENVFVISYHDEEIIELDGKRNIVVHVVVNGNQIKNNEDELKIVEEVKKILRERFSQSEYHIVVDKEFNNL